MFWIPTLGPVAGTLGYGTAWPLSVAFLSLLILGACALASQRYGGRVREGLRRRDLPAGILTLFEKGC